ncbi:MAG: hypothetical protein SFV51_06840, partial [Bryobacteraceae bacterium]|nr:hypothetical protein [Bryobacteraceae bacterium]
MRWLAGLLALWAAGCGRYEEFRLPVVNGAQAPGGYLWEPLAAPVMARGAAGQWDSVDTLNPSVVAHGGGYLNFYSGFDGKTWHTGLAASADGLAWTRKGKVLSPEAAWEGDYIAANGSALGSGDEFLYWYQAGRTPRIGLARSADGVKWRREPMPVLDLGPRGSWDERGVADPYVMRVDGAFYMFYLGQDRARRQRLGIA